MKLTKFKSTDTFVRETKSEDISILRAEQAVRPKAFGLTKKAGAFTVSAIVPIDAEYASDIEDICESAKDGETAYKAVCDHLEIDGSNAQIVRRYAVGEQPSKAWQRAMQYDGERIAKNLRNLSTPDGEPIWTLTEFLVEGGKSDPKPESIMVKDKTKPKALPRVG